MSGLALADPALARAIGSEAKLALRGIGDRRAATYRSIRSSLASHDLDARYSGLLAPKKVHGRLEVTARDLSRFARARRRRPQGRSARDRRSRRRAELWRADRDDRRAGDASRHRLSDARPRDRRRPAPDRRRAHDGRRRLRLHRSRRERRAWLSEAQRRFRPRQGRASRRSVDVPQASVLDPRVSGKAEIVATLTGTPDDLNAALKATLGDGRLLDRKTSGLTLEAQRGPHHRAARGEGLGLGRHRRPPAAGLGPCREDAPTAAGAPTISRSASPRRGSTGNVAIGADQLATGELSFSAANLDDLSPLVLTKMSGALQAKVSASAADGKQAVAVDRQQRPDGVRREQARRPQGRSQDRRPLGRAKHLRPRPARRAEVAGQSVSDIKLTATGQGDFERPRLQRLRCAASR